MKQARNRPLWPENAADQLFNPTVYGANNKDGNQFLRADHEQIRRSTLRVDARKWLASNPAVHSSAHEQASRTSRARFFLPKRTPEPSSHPSAGRRSICKNSSRAKSRKNAAPITAAGISMD
jgi:hypothetical protein